MTYSVQMVDLATQSLLTDVSVKVCGLTDINCGNPKTPSDLHPDEGGWVNVPLTDNFQGYLEIQAPEHVKFLFHLPESGLHTMRDFPIVMISELVYAQLVQALMIQDDMALGSIGIRSFDCNNNLAPGVVLRSNTGGVPWYFANGFPNTLRVETDSDGLGGFLRSPPGPTIADAFLSDGTPIASQGLVVRAGWMSTGYLRPAQAIAIPTAQVP